MTEPNWLRNFHIAYTDNGAKATTITLGYFIYDIIDMFLTAWSEKGTGEVMLHHTFSGICIAYAAVNGNMVGFSLIGMTIEFNTIFLHLRKLLRMSGTIHSSLFSNAKVMFLVLRLVWTSSGLQIDCLD